MSVTPMFPLGTVLLPGMAVPLHVFEDRYREMVDDCLAGDETFGVVLIERGSEVGGGDVRTDVGTLVRIAESRQLPDGRWLLGVIGIERIRVDRWLPDDPYPQAEVTPWPDDVDGSEEDEAPAGTAEPPDAHEKQAGADRRAAFKLLRRVTAFRSELGQPAPPLQLELPEDPVLASYAAVALSPLGPADRQKLLSAPTVPTRWTELTAMLTDQLELLQAQLPTGDDPEPGD